jgi:hypothetical protein
MKNYTCMSDVKIGQRYIRVVDPEFGWPHSLNVIDIFYNDKIDCFGIKYEAFYDSMPSIIFTKSLIRFLGSFIDPGMYKLSEQKL